VAVSIAAPIGLLIASPWWLLTACIALLAAWMALTRVGQQTWSVAQLGISSIPKRLGPSAVIVVGIAGVVGVLVALLAMGTGFERTLSQTGTDDTAIVMSRGSPSEVQSILDHDTIETIAQAPQILKNAGAQPIISPELVVSAPLPKKGGGLNANANVQIRGVGERIWDLRRNIRITAGRKFNSGLRELLVGKGALQQFAGIGIGSTVILNSQPWVMVGIFDSGDAYNSEIWADAGALGSGFRRGSNSTSVMVRLTDNGAFDAFKATLASDPRLKVDVQTTRQYYAKQSEGLSKMIRIVGTIVGAIMAVGAMLGALNTMNAAISTRAREIATLRAIGFRSVPVVVSVLVETMLLAALGGIIGAAIAWTIFDGFTASTVGANFNQVVFAFNVSPGLLWYGLKWALAIGLVGGLLPALHAASLSITVGLREL